MFYEQFLKDPNSMLNLTEFNEVPTELSKYLHMISIRFNIFDHRTNITSLVEIPELPLLKIRTYAKTPSGCKGGYLDDRSNLCFSISEISHICAKVSRDHTKWDEGMFTLNHTFGQAGCYGEEMKHMKYRQLDLDYVDRAEEVMPHR
jgi:hypothetical protein